jgi:hypothetical protein
MTKYKVVNHLFDTKEGKSLRIESVYGSFEEVADKIIKDLNSVWKGIVPLPFRIEIVEAKSDEEGMSMFEGDTVLSHNPDKMAGVLETYGYFMKKEYDDL